MASFKKPVRSTGFRYTKAVQGAYGRRLARAGKTSLLQSAQKTFGRKRLAGFGEKELRIEWFIKNVSDKVTLTLDQRVRLATEFVKNKVIRNISVPVGREKVTVKIRKNKEEMDVAVDKYLSGKVKKIYTTKKRTFTRITRRSKPGEYPRADTTQLMKTIFGVVVSTKGSATGYVGTPIDYGFILETSKSLRRSFLRRTLREQRGRVMKILTGPIK